MVTRYKLCGTRHADLRVSALALAVACLGAGAAPAHAGTYAPWLTQVGINDTVMSAAKWGSGALLGTVDTGISPTHMAFAAGQISAALSSCAALSFKCSNGYIDDNGHGTAVAAIAAGNRTSPFSKLTYAGYTTLLGNQLSVAPNANILAEKVLGAAGTGYSIDVANGVIKAANAGAQVINVSITFGNSADMVSAINYAASKGAFIVWAGGNSAASLLNGANTNGLSAAAVKRLIFAGSVNASNALSYFSNKPGAGNLVDTGGAKTAYANRWLMAPGEGIVAPSAAAGSTAWAYWSGTSMSTPMISGSLLLLENAWPILRTNGTAANLLLATASDLGSKGVDATYGNGLMNVSAAFQPNGALTVTKANGQVVPVASLTGALITGGALGSLSSVQAKLSNYTAFDSYSRNYSVNLAGLIAVKPTGATVNPLPTNVNTGVVKIKLADGGEFAYLDSSQPNRASQLGVFAYNADLVAGIGSGYAMWTDRVGSTVAMGYGQTAQQVSYSFGSALFGNNDLATLASADSQGLSEITQGGGMFAYGFQAGEQTRVAMAWTGTPQLPVATWTSGPYGATETANQIKAGIATQLNSDFVLGANLGFLWEKQGLLGSAYDSQGALGLGGSNRSTSLGIAGGYRAGPHSLLLDATLVTTAAAEGSGLLAGTTRIQSRGWGVAYMARVSQFRDDNLTMSLRQPLRVVSGQIGVQMPGIEVDGTPRYATEWSSLTPSGRELDYQLAYNRAVGKGESLNVGATYRKDALNLEGTNTWTVGARYTLKF